MKIYRIWNKGTFTSCGFKEYDDSPTHMIYSSYEIAKQHLPDSYNDGYGNCGEFYIKEEEIE